MTRRAAIFTIFAAMLAIALCYASAFLPSGTPGWAAWVIIIATAAVMVAVLVLGAARRGAVRHPALKVTFISTFLLLAGGFALALRAPAVTPDAKLWLGLPQGAAVILFIVGFAPMAILPIAYALTFESTTLSDDELADIRARLAELSGVHDDVEGGKR